MVRQQHFPSSVERAFAPELWPDSPGGIARSFLHISEAVLQTLDRLLANRLSLRSGSRSAKRIGLDTCARATTKTPARSAARVSECVGYVVFAQKLFPCFLRLFEPALILRVESDVTPETSVVHQLQPARFTKTLALFDPLANLDEPPGS